MPKKGAGRRVNTVISQDGVNVTFNGTVTHGTYADGESIWVVGPVTPLSVVVDSGESVHTTMGAMMVDPQGLARQGFDSRGTVGTGFGPALSYDAALAVALGSPIDHYVDNSPKTLWFYRMRDTLQVGGSYTGCWAIVQITIVHSAPAANAIKPTGFYVSGGKPTYTTDDINYSVVSPLAIPSGAVEFDWDAAPNVAFVGQTYPGYGYLRRPLICSGTFDTLQFIGCCNPHSTQPTYPAEQAIQSGQLLLGALSDSADRDMLIERVVRAGLDVHAQMAFGHTCCIAGGGFGQGYAPLLFMASIFLEEPTMRAVPDQVTIYTGHDVEYFAEHGQTFIGNTTVDYPEGKPLYGVISSAAYPAGPFGDNHDQRDTNGDREPHWMSRSSGTARGGSANTIQLAAAFPAIDPTGYTIYLTGGPGSGDARRVLSWNAGTQTITTTANFSATPTTSTTYEYYNGGEYQVVGSSYTAGSAIAVVASGMADEWQSFDPSASWLYYTKRWIDEQGELNPRYPEAYSQVQAAIDSRSFQDQNGTWVKKFYTDYAESTWPVQGAPAATTIFSATLTSNDPGWGGYTQRNGLVISGGAGASNEICVTFEADSGQQLDIAHASIGISSRSDLNAGHEDCTGTPIELTFNSGSHGVSISAGQSKASDWVSLGGFTSSNILEVTIDFGGSNANPRRIASAGGAGNLAYKAGAASYNSQNLAVDGYQSSIYCVNKIEVR